MKNTKIDSGVETLMNEMIGHDHMTALRGTEINRVTAHIREVQAHRRINGVRGQQQLPGGQQLLLNGEKAEESVKRQRILIRN